ncbi:E3 ubiquitin-protein ligase UHRF1-like [Aricia agestis]|uniref:E3 ubiquitin-protein ligase UHRF1-like n=1 Tax=Aricia agestis TaxID=91739 RepID=UPI001C20B51B|nr:E3 ubiquitin-protein ligase UHRF1-like [Aricia agestis]
MHVRVRKFGKPDTIVVVESKLTKIDQFRRIIKDKFDVEPKLQRLFYGGKLLENGYTFHDYNIKLNDVIQLMVVQAVEESQDEKEIKKECVEKDEDNKENVNYTDAKSTLYAVGDLIDMRDREEGVWLEGKIVRIVTIANTIPTEDVSDSVVKTENSNLENIPPSSTSPNESKSKKGIAKYFQKQDANAKKQIKKDTDEESLCFKIQLDHDEEDSKLYCKLNEIRPRARKEINVKDLKPGQKVMVNYNTEEPLQKGYWYDFKVDKVNKTRTNYELIGTLYLGQDAVPQNETKVCVHDKIFAIESVVPLADRTEEYKKKMSQAPEKRSMPLNCLTCRDVEEMPCKDCGCYLCLGKENPEKILLCDDCNNGFHMDCLDPPLKQLPDDDWYCPSCKRDPNEVIAPGAGKQRKKQNTSKTNRDWGRGMACVGKTKTCAMPANHFGPIPGIEVGMCWRFRIQLSESGVHRPPVSGIHGRDVEGAYSIVLSGGYEDDVDNGIEFTYTGSGGRDLSGNKRTAEQSCDQTLTRENKALARNCAVKEINEKGADAGESWQQGKPVRVVRSYKMLKHFPKYAPKEGIRYDGIYKVVKYYPEKGLSGFRVWKYLLRRDDPNPAPWEPGAKQFQIVYPDGYLEAEAEKKALKEKNSKGKRTLREKNTSQDDIEHSPPAKKQKRNKKNDPNVKSPPKIPAMFTKSPKSKEKQKGKKEMDLSVEEKDKIEADTLNSKLWTECLDVCKNQGKKEFIEHLTQAFLCIICQDVAVNPVTTPCLHNFCMGCIKLAFKSNKTHNCPCCRQNLAKVELEVNENLKTALRTILTGYDAGKK